MVSRWQRRRQLRRTIRSHRAPRGWRPPPPTVEPAEPDARVDVGAPAEDSGEVTRQLLLDGGPTARLAVGARAGAEPADEGWVAAPEPPPDGPRPGSGAFGRTVAWVLVGLLTAGMVALVLAGFWV